MERGRRNRRVVRLSMLVAAALAGAGGTARAQQPAATPPVRYLDQGWSAADRDTFYTTSQGSHMMPFAYFKALRRLDSDQPFGADQLERYGYLRNDSPTNVNGLPVGFVVDGASGQLGMTCAACHTGQLEYQNDGVTQAVRLDGAPANADFQQFLLDLAAAARATLTQPKRFDAFAKDVLGTGDTPAAAAKLRTDFGAWVRQFGAFMDKSLPARPWGPGRLDAFGMIYNRVAGRDLGLERFPHDNFRKADAPVSYPFVWNASRQDHTQWNAGVPNGLYLQGLARNSGEVFGVFADLRSRKLPLVPLVDFGDNSADYAGLQTLEEKIAALKPPPWPYDLFPIDEALAKRGEALFAADCSKGCHEEKASDAPGHGWVTPALAVGTDPRMAVNAGRKSYAGLFIGTPLPPPKLGLYGASADTADMLASSVIGSLLNEASDAVLHGRVEQSGVWRAIRKDWADLVPDQKADVLAHLNPETLKSIHDRIKERLAALFRPAPETPRYEARVLHGIWATAPYLHNGSVASLWELMLPAKQRMSTFRVGSRLFDPKNVGYATDRSPFRNGTFVADPKSGNGNGGHEYGTGLSEADRWAIIEYLKTL